MSGVDGLRGGPDRARRLRAALAGAALAVAGGAGFAGALRPADLVLPLVVAALVGGAASLLSGDDGAGLRAAGGLLGLMALGTVPALGASPAVLGDLGDGVRLLRATLGPAPGEPELLAVPYTATAVAALVGARSGLRWGPRYGVRLLPGLVVMGLGAAVGDEARTTSAWVPAVWVVVALLATVADRRTSGAAPVSGRGRVSWRVVLPAAVVVLAVAGAAGPVGEWLPGAERPPKVLPAGQAVPLPPLENALATVTDLQRGPDQPLFTAETSEPVSRWRLAVLTEYDGTAWTPADRFDPVSRDVPRPAVTPTGTARDVAQTVELAPGTVDGGGGRGDGSPGIGTGTGVPPWGPWLPVADRVVEISEDGLLFNPGGGTLLAPADVPAAYRATSVVGTPDPARLAEAGPGRDGVAAAALELPDDRAPEGAGPGMLGELQQLAGEITGGAASANARAVAIQQHLLNGPNRLDPRRSGQTLRQVHTFLHSEGGALGSTEQYVTAYALLARASGLPARVVVGFDGSGVAGRHTVTAHDAAAWVEVRFDGVGWVRFDPVPDPSGTVAPPEPPEAADGPRDEPPPPEPASPEGAAADPDGDDGEPSTAPEDGFAVPVAEVLVAVLVLLVVVTAGPPAVRARRRRRRGRATEPRARIAGAWATVIDEARLAGVPVASSLAVSDVVRAGSRQLPTGAEQLAALGSLANRASFAPDPPGPAEAARAWDLCGQWVAARRSGRSLRRRLRDHLTL